MHGPIKPIHLKLILLLSKFLEDRFVIHYETQVAQLINQLEQHSEFSFEKGKLESWAAAFSDIIMNYTDYCKNSTRTISVEQIGTWFRISPFTVARKSLVIRRLVY